MPRGRTSLNRVIFPSPSKIAVREGRIGLTYSTGCARHSYVSRLAENRDYFASEAREIYDTNSNSVSRVAAGSDLGGRSGHIQHSTTVRFDYKHIQ